MAWREEGEGADSRRCGEAPGHDYEKVTVCTSWKCFKLYVHKCVYKPAEDSVLALEALRELRERGLEYERIVDVGTGSGILALAAYELFKPSLLAAIDISPYAVQTAKLNLPEEAHIAQCNGLKCLNTHWDLAILNPPYLPLEPSERGDPCTKWLQISWSGGGGVMRSLTLETLKASNEVLLVHSTLSPVTLEELEAVASVEVLGAERFFFEEIKALRLKRRTTRG